MNQLDPEKLRILSIPKVQEFLKKRMGPLQIGDSIWLNNREQIVYDVNGSTICFVAIGDSLDTTDAFPYRRKSDENFLRIPRSIDDRNPERGLWGMLDKTKKRLIGEKNGNHRVCITPNEFISDKNYHAVTPYLALLRALCAQEGIEG